MKERGEINVQKKSSCRRKETAAAILVGRRTFFLRLTHWHWQQLKYNKLSKSGTGGGRKEEGKKLIPLILQWVKIRAKTTLSRYRSVF